MQTKIKNSLFIIIAVSLCLLTVIIYLPRVIQARTDSDITELNNWYYTDGIGKTVDIKLPQKLHMDENGNIMISTRLPEDFKPGQTMCFYTYYQAVEVYLENELIYRFDNTGGGSFGKAATSQWNFIDLPEKADGGKLITIKMHTPYSDIGLKLTEVICGSSAQVNKWINRSFNYLRLMELAFIGIGALMCIIVVFQKIGKRERNYQFYSGLVFIAFSIYLRIGAKGLPIYWMSNFAKEFCSYLCLLFMSLPLTLYIKERVHENRKMQLWCDILVITEMLSGTGALLLHGVGIADIHSILPICLIILLTAVITSIVFSGYYATKLRNKAAVGSFVSGIIIMLCLITECVQFYHSAIFPLDMGLLCHLGLAAVIVIETSVQFFFITKEIKVRNVVEEENHSLQLQLLTDQIRPHFLLNTVGAIRTLIHEDPDRASDLLYEFSKYFRKNFEQKDYTKPIPFPQELDYISTYLKLERARFSDRINIELELETKEFWVLPLTVQPFVENAVKHGLLPLNSTGTIKIATKKLKDATLIEIIDNGVGFDVKTLEQKKSVGMKSAEMRLRDGLNAKIDIKSSMTQGKSGTTVSIVIPDKRSVNK